MARFRPLMLVLLLLLPLVGARAQDLPPQFALALDSLSSRLGRPITVRDLDSWKFEQNLYTDTALGCPFVTGTPRPEGISGFTFTMVFQGVTYDYRVAADGSLTFACDQSASQPQATAQPTNCPAAFVGYLPPRLKIGDSARIGTGSTANRLRDGASANANQIGLIQPGETVRVADGPVCEDQSHIIWWRVDDNGVTGWTAEGVLPDNYFLAPVGLSLPAERDLISIDNADMLVPLTTISLAGVSSIGFTQDSTLIALGGLSGLAVYDLGTLTLRTNLGDISAPVTAVAFSPDRHYLAYSKQDGTLLLDDLLANTHVTLNQTPNTHVNSLAFSAAPPYMLAAGVGSPVNAPGSSSAIVVFDVTGQKALTTMPAPSWVRNVAFNPDGRLFAWLDSSVSVIQVAGGATVRTLALGQPSAGGLVWRPASTGQAPRSLAFDDGAMIRLVNLDTSVEQTYEGDPGFVPAALAFNPDGSLLAAMNVPDNTATASTVNIFDTDTSDLITSTPLQSSSALAFSPDGTLLVIGSNDEVVFLGVNNSALAVG